MEWLLSIIYFILIYFANWLLYFSNFYVLDIFCDTICEMLIKKFYYEDAFNLV